MTTLRLELERMTDDQNAGETRDCPYCYAQLDVRADVCGHCHAYRDTASPWARRMNVYRAGGMVFLIGLFITFIDGTDITWVGVPFLLLGTFFLARTHKLDLSQEIWHRKE